MIKINLTLFKLVALLLLSLYTSKANSQKFDINTLRDINLKRDKSLDPTFKFFTNSVVPVTIGAPLVIYAVGYLNKDIDLKRKGIYIGETFLVNAFVTTALKYSVNRARPYVTYPEIDKQTSGGSGSFPSGHTSDAFATATSLSIAFPKWYVIAPSFIWASAVGYSRMDLGVHYPTDVFAGAIIGSGSAYFCYKLNHWMNKKSNKSIFFEGNKKEVTTH